MAVLTYQNGENYISFSNGQSTKCVEWIHSGLLRIYTEKNSEELVNNKLVLTAEDEGKAITVYVIVSGNTGGN